MMFSCYVNLKTDRLLFVPMSIIGGGSLFTTVTERDKNYCRSTINFVFLNLYIKTKLVKFGLTNHRRGYKPV